MGSPFSDARAGAGEWDAEERPFASVTPRPPTLSHSVRAQVRLGPLTSGMYENSSEAHVYVLSREGQERTELAVLEGEALAELVARFVEQDVADAVEAPRDRGSVRADPPADLLDVPLLEVVQTKDVAILSGNLRQHL